MPTNNSFNNKSQELTVDPGASGDSFVQFDINGTGEFRIGVDDGAGDSFKMSQGSAIGTNDTFVMTAAGERTMPLQPGFLTTQAANQLSVTGSGTNYTVIFSNEIFDQNSDFDGTSTFTAPITGRYFFTYSMQVIGLTTSHTNNFVFCITSNANYRGFQIDFTPAPFVLGGVWVFNGNFYADMDASDTAVVHLRCIGAVSDTLGIVGSTDAGFRTPFFAGWLVN